MSLERAWRDPVIAFVLTTAAIAGWWTTFDGLAWLVVGAAGAAVGTVVVLLHARLGSLVWAFVSVPVAYLLLGIVVLGVDFTGGSLRGTTFTRVLTGAWESWRLLVGTHPPVEATGTVLLAPAMAGLLVAAQATAFTRAGSRPGWPLAPILGLLAWVLVTGSHLTSSGTWSRILFGGVFGLACLAWVVLRAGRTGSPTDSPASARWVLAAPVLVVSTLLAVPLGGSLLGDGEQRLVLREQTAAYAVDLVGTPLDSFRRFRKQSGDLPDNAWRTQLLRATSAPDGTVLRFTVLDRYDGRRWVAANDVEPGSHDDRFQLFGADYLTTPDETGTTPIRIDLTGAWNSQWLPLAGRLVGLNTDFPGGVPVSSLRFNPVTSTAIATRTLGGNDEYEFFAEFPDPTLPDHAEASRLVDRPTYDAAEFLDNWAEVARRGTSSRMEAVLKAASMMRARGRYSDGAFGWEVQFARGQDEARLDDFMNGPHMVGDDEQYAAAMALVATRLRVPARVVVGARVPADGIVKGNDVVAWVELRIADGTWHELPRSAYMSFRSPRRNDPENDPVAAEPDTSPTATSRPSPSPSPSPQPDQDHSDQQDRAEQSSGSWRWLLWLLVPVAVGAVPGYKLLRRARRRRASRVSVRYVGAWQELIDRARDLGLPVPAHRSRPAQAVALGTFALPLARTADDAVFGPATPSIDEADSYWGSVLEVRAGLGPDVPAWRRWLAPFSPASLRQG
ncbi:transglutaminase domain-containing protein [Nocardioides islandensis]|uniref:Transglutaminase domain-containing protein n=1 Tax=Nocardioides islandensis TaxID=433663 RepID=A0A930YIT4_9ACTN|nr:transglutaminase-like domain-containing protein [Nocardioides islandensis]MBF4762030.1 transglutaminase domain-containing protein [Nocardioides islandensis]